MQSIVNYISESHKGKWDFEQDPRGEEFCVIEANDNRVCSICSLNWILDTCPNDVVDEMKKILTNLKKGESYFDSEVIYVKLGDIK